MIFNCSFVWKKWKVGDLFSFPYTCPRGLYVDGITVFVLVANAIEFNKMLHK